MDLENNNWRIIKLKIKINNKKGLKYKQKKRHITGL